MKSSRNISPTLRFKILARYDFKCFYCGLRAPEGGLHVDHVIPWSKGGSDAEDNLVAACVVCNTGKGDKVFVIEGKPGSVGRRPVRPRRGFLRWLRKQEGREDPVGDFADDVARDKWPLDEPETFSALAKELRARSACEKAINAAWHAWREHRRGKPTQTIADVQARMRQNVEDNATDEACLWLKDGVMMAGVFYPHRDGPHPRQKRPKGIR